MCSLLVDFTSLRILLFLFHNLLVCPIDLRRLCTPTMHGAGRPQPEGHGQRGMKFQLLHRVATTEPSVASTRRPSGGAS
eukprot:COSAG01_NODE_17239_length_1167_cov_1.878277_3_plen_78_part_01